MDVLSYIPSNFARSVARDSGGDFCFLLPQPEFQNKIPSARKERSCNRFHQSNKISVSLDSGNLKKWDTAFPISYSNFSAILQKMKR